MRVRLALACVLLVLARPEAQEPPRTWRLDFYQTGGPGIEAYSFDRLVIEPLAWPDRPTADLEPSPAGNYRFDVIDGTGRVIFARGYDPAFAEWVTTAEVRRVRRTFHDSLRFPAPPGKAEVVIHKRNQNGGYDEVWRHAIDPADPFIDRSTPPRQQAIEVERHGEPQTKVDVLLLGDGYTAAECGVKFPADARRMASALFAQEPFTSRRTDFNIWGICPPAAESGISRPSTGVYRRSPVGASYDAFGSERYILTFENRAMRDLAAWAPYEYLTILTNGAIYGGGGLYNVLSTVAVDNDFADYLFVHEFAHHFAGLADEYYTSPVAYEPPARIVEPWPANVTTETDPSRLKWRDLLTPGVPIPTPWPKQEFETLSKEIQARRARLRAENRPEAEMTQLFREQRETETRLLAAAEHARKVGLFQGANYDAQAFYRPEIDCLMFARNEVPFCRVCQRALAGVIDRHSTGLRP
ncbi:MAG: peptidase M64 [Acidobacteria bacterium]|nr:peptidase M64 [Acidobacteriota bacterium]